ncbi:MAG: lantibiotic dehydratase, partial [Lactobacillus crispatus]|nr:lantibiotic dehydratase [Lactobacillus crispatus]MCT7699316.1 lantibiotic dehydratase [Lactobacillus crispatus]
MHPKLLERYVIRTSNFSDDRTINRILADDNYITLTDYEKIISQLSNNTKFMEALLIASPALYRSVYNFQHLSTKKQRSTILSLLEYMKRAVNRVTPFGLFSSVSLSQGTIFPKKLNQAVKRHIRLSPNWLLQLYNDVIKNINEAPYQKISVSATLTDQNDYYINYILGENPVFNEGESVRYKKNKLLSTIITKVLKNPGITFFDLIAYLSSNLDNVSLRDIVSVIVQLLVERLLITNLYPNKGMSIQEFEDYVHTLNKIYPQYSKMTQIRQTILLGKRYEKEGGVANYQALNDCLLNLYDEKNAIIVDSESIKDRSYRIALSDDQKLQLRDLTHLLILLSNSMPTTNKMALENYKDKFVEKYGYLTNIPLLKVFDDNFGIGSPFSNVKFSKKQLNLQQKFVQYLVSEQKKSCLKHGYWELSEIDLSKERFSKISDKYLDMSVDINFKYYCKNNTINTLILGKSPSSFLGEGFSERFSYFLDMSSKNTHPVNNVCSIQYIPANDKVANIFYSKSYRNKKLLVNGYSNSNDKKITLSDILVSVNKNNEFEFCDATGNVLMFDQQCMANTELESDIIKFLVCSSSPSYYIPEFVGLINNLKSMMNETIKYKQIIVAPKHWNIPTDVVLDKLDNLNMFFEQIDIPKSFNLIESDQSMPLNLSSKLDIEILAKHCKHTKERMLTFEEKNLGQELNINGELTLTFDYKQFSCVNRTSLSKLSRNNSFRYPKDWIYVKLYLPKSEEDYFLTNIIANFVEENNISDWFFIRYKDSKNHIRFRFRITDDRHIIELFRWAQSLKNKSVISSYDIAPYMRELERYGDTKVYEMVENIFNIDSKKSLLLLNTSGNKDARILLDLKDLLISTNIPQNIILNVLKNSTLKDKKIKREFVKIKKQVSV